MAFGSGMRPWVRGTLAKIASSTAVLGQGELLVDEAGGLYGGDGITQIKKLKRAVRQGELVLNVRDYGAKGDGSADDTAAIIAAFTAASAITLSLEVADWSDSTLLPAHPKLFFPFGLYNVSSQITIPQGCSFLMAKGARLRATAAMVSILNTDPSVVHQNQLWQGGILDCAGLAQSGFTIGCVLGCQLWDVDVYNPTQHAIIVGDPSAVRVPYGMSIRLGRIMRPRGVTPPAGYAALWMRNCTDSVIEAGTGAIRGFDIGTKNDSGNNEFRTIHPGNPTAQGGPATMHDEGAGVSGTRLIGYVFDSPGLYGLRVRGAGPLTLIAPQFYLNNGIPDNTATAIYCDGSPSLSVIGGAIYSVGASNRWKADITVIGNIQGVRWMTISDANTVITRKWGSRNYVGGHYYDSGSVTPVQIAAGSAQYAQQVLVTGGATAAGFTSTGGVLAGNTTNGGSTTYSGSGAPTVAGSVGDFYLRKDTPGTAGQRIYVCTVAGVAGSATWVATAA